MYNLIRSVFFFLLYVRSLYTSVRTPIKSYEQSRYKRPGARAIKVTTKRRRRTQPNHVCVCVCVQQNLSRAHGSDRYTGARIVLLRFRTRDRRCMTIVIIIVIARWETCCCCWFVFHTFRHISRARPNAVAGFSPSFDRAPRRKALDSRITIVRYAHVRARTEISARVLVWISDIITFRRWRHSFASKTPH